MGEGGREGGREGGMGEEGGRKLTMHFGPFVEQSGQESVLGTLYLCFTS